MVVQHGTISTCWHVPEERSSHAAAAAAAALEKAYHHSLRDPNNCVSKYSLFLEDD